MVFEKLCAEFLLNAIATWKGKGEEYAPGKGPELVRDLNPEIFDGTNGSELLLADLKNRVKNITDSSWFNDLPPARITHVLVSKAIMSLRDLVVSGVEIPAAVRIEKIGDIVVYMLILNAVYTMDDMEEAIDQGNAANVDKEIADVRRYVVNPAEDLFDDMMTLIFKVKRL